MPWTASIVCYTRHMRTTLNLPSRLMKEAQRRSGMTTKTAAILVALQEFVDRRRALEAFDALTGQVIFSLDPMNVRHANSSAARARKNKK